MDLRTVQRWYAAVVIVAALAFATSIGAYYSESEPIVTVSADDQR